jgi:hypothetical protein
MRSVQVVAGVAVVAVLFGVGVIATARGENGQHFAQVDRGRYLADVADCTACHTTPGVQPSFSWQLSDEQVAAVATYVRNSFGNSGTSVTVENAQDARYDLQSRADTN